MISKLFWVAVAGGIGTLARYSFYIFFEQRFASMNFPVATMVVNIAGCFLAGLLWMLFESRFHISPDIRVVVFLGFLGAFTTFSTFILETGQLMQGGAWMKAGVNLMIQQVLGIIALYGGFSLARIS